MAAPTQQELAQQLARTYELINQQLEKQLLLQNAVLEAAKGASANMAGVADLTSDQLDAVGAGSTNAASGISDLTGAVKENTEAVVENQQASDSALASTADVPKAAMQAYDSATKALQALIPQKLRNELDFLQAQFGGLANVGGPGGPFNATNQQAKAFVKTTQEVYHGLLATEGAFADAFGYMPQRVLGDLGKVMGNFNELFGGAQGMLNSLKLAKVATGEFVMENQALAKAAGYSVEQQQTFMSRQISLTGEASNDMLREAAVFSKRLAGMTGDSAKMISQNIVGLIDDTEKFGNVSVAEAARISVNLRQLGLGYQELGGMVKKFMNFEDAATSVSALTTVFGVQMDAMEMMQLANEDQEGFLRRIRDQFLATAKSVDDMSLAEKRLIMQQTGLSNVEAVERLLDPSATISSMEELTSQTGDVGKDVSATMKYLAEDIVDLQQAVDFSSEHILNNINEKMREPLAETVIVAEQGAARIAGAFEKAVPANLQAGLAIMGKGMSDLVNVDEDTISQIGDGIRGLGDALAGMVESGATSQVATDLESMANSADTIGGELGTNISAGLVDGFKLITEEFSTVITSLENVIKNSALYSESPSLLGENMKEGIAIPMNELPDIFYEAFGGATAEAEAAMAAMKLTIDEDMRDSAESMTITADQVQALFESNAQSASNLMEELAEREEDSLKKSDMLVAARTANRVQGEQDYAKAATEAAKNVSEEQASFYEGVTKISGRELQEQLGQSDSYYTQMARELGRMGISYEDMTDVQKKHYAEQFKLGDDYEAKLKQIMESEQHATGSSERDQAAVATDVLKRMQDSGRQYKDLGRDFKDMMMEENNLTEADLMAMFGEENRADVEGIVTGGLRAKRDAADREAREKRTEASDEAATQEAANRVSQQAAAATKRTAVSSQKMLELLQAQPKEFEKIVTAVNELELSPEVFISLDGKSFVQYVIDNPRGTKQRIVLDTLG